MPPLLVAGNRRSSPRPPEHASCLPFSGSICVCAAAVEQCLSKRSLPLFVDSSTVSLAQELTSAYQNRKGTLKQRAVRSAVHLVDGMQACSAETIAALRGCFVPSDPPLEYHSQQHRASRHWDRTVATTWML